jgi:ribosome maturation factor RimP
MRWAICPFFISKFYLQIIDKMKSNWRKRLAKFEQKLTDMLRPAVEETGKSLLGIEFISAGNNSVLRLFVDHENGIDVDDCAEVSRQVSALLDVEDPISSEYNLEVSSPGVDRPLFEKSHFEAIIGEVVNVKISMPLNGRRKFKGPLVAIENDTLIIEVDSIDYEIVISNIDKANLVAKF